LQFSGRRIHRVKPATVSPEINDPLINRRRSRGAHTQRELPFLCAGLEIESVKIPVRAGYVDRAVGHGRRRDHLAASLKLPFDPAELLDTAGVVDTGVSQIAAEHRRVLSTGGQGKTDGTKHANAED